MAKAKKLKRKHVFINRKLQGRYMVTFLVPMLIMLVFMIFTLYFAANSIIHTAAIIVKEDVQNIVTIQFQDEMEPTVASYKKIVGDINNYLREFSENKKYRNAVLMSLLWVFGIGFFLIIIQLVLLTIFFSHKLAGPIYRFETVCHNILNGKYTDKIVLRKGDDMQNLATLLNDVIAKTRDIIKGLKKAESDEEKEKIISSIEI
jgi:nitrogen fixation/metabolism regulation signal transduction histidine kinase